MRTASPERQKKTKAPIFKKQPSEINSPAPTEDEEEEEEEGFFELEHQGDSDELDEIEADLSNTDLSNLDQELDQIETEFSSP